MALDPQKLDEIIRSGDVVACVAFFRGASEAERKKVAKVAVSHLRELTTHIDAGQAAGLTCPNPSRAGVGDPAQHVNLGPSGFQVIQVAVLASAPLSKWRSLGLEGMPPARRCHPHRSPAAVAGRGRRSVAGAEGAVQYGLLAHRAPDDS